MKLRYRILDAIIRLITLVVVGAMWYFAANLYYYI